MIHMNLSRNQSRVLNRKSGVASRLAPKGAAHPIQKLLDVSSLLVLRALWTSLETTRLLSAVSADLCVSLDTTRLLRATPAYLRVSAVGVFCKSFLLPGWVVAQLVVFVALVSPRDANAQTVRVDISPGHEVNSFVPNQALGAGIDRLPAGAADKLLTGPILQQILSAGWGPVSYRQNTELFVEAWHWNPQGSWSDPSGKGYFTGNAAPSEPIRHSYGYLLPHRGFTRNDGTENHGYSRLTDGDDTTYWKSNPYLTKQFTGEDDSLHPQWVILDFANPELIDSIRIAWGSPYARRYLVQYWTGDDPIKAAVKGVWHTFPNGEITDGKGGITAIKLATSPISVRFIRIWMTQSSNTPDSHGASDPRNCVGYAISELYAGTSGADGELHDVIRHEPDQAQTTTYCSSIDPWHEPSNIDPQMRDQVGFDLFYTSGVTRGLPAMIPIAMLYGTPEDSAAQIAYIEKRGYPISYVEMGEEPDGQFMLPEDYAALYVQWAAALHKVDPHLKLGGPVFQGVNQDIEVWPNEEGKASWLGRFFDYLKSHGRISDLAFLSFEHYPLEPCKLSWSTLYEEPTLVSHILQVWRDDGLPAGVPMIISESNISWQSDESFLDAYGALWLADYIGAFLAAGGDSVYFFHYMPLPLERGCNNSMGSFGLLTVDSNLNFLQYTSQYFASQMITKEWAQPGDGRHKVFSAAADPQDSAGHSLITAYAALRPDGRYSIMLINKDQENAHAVSILFHDGNGQRTFKGPVDVVTFGSEQYKWRPTASGGSADPDGPAAHATMSANPQTRYQLPKASITVIRGAITAR